jgi:hypothetical protein
MAIFNKNRSSSLSCFLFSLSSSAARAWVGLPALELKFELFVTVVLRVRFGRFALAVEELLEGITIESELARDEEREGIGEVGVEWRGCGSVVIVGEEGVDAE